MIYDKSSYLKINKTNYIIYIMLKDTNMIFLQWNVSFHQYFEFRSSILNILEYLSDVLKCVHFRFSLEIEEKKIECAKKILFNFHSIYFTRDICANALFVSNIGIIISYCCKMSFYSIVESFLFPSLQKYFFL